VFWINSPFNEWNWGGYDDDRTFERQTHTKAAVYQPDVEIAGGVYPGF
jgi:hypothetical protein